MMKLLKPSVSRRKARWILFGVLSLVFLSGCREDAIPFLEAFVGVHEGIELGDWAKSNEVGSSIANNPSPSSTVSLAGLNQELRAELQRLSQNQFLLILTPKNRTENRTVIEIAVEKSENIQWKQGSSSLRLIPKDSKGTEKCWAEENGKKSAPTSLCLLEDKMILSKLSQKDSVEVYRLELEKKTLQKTQWPSAEIRISQLLQLTQNYNYDSRVEVERLKQSQARTRILYGNLVTHLTINTYAGYRLYNEFLGSLAMFADLFPFFWPNRWFDAQASDFEKKAQEVSVEVVRANAVLQAEILALSLLRDQRVLESLEEVSSTVLKIENRMKAYEELGFFVQGTFSHLNALRTRLDLAADEIRTSLQSGFLELSVVAGFLDPLAVTKIVDDQDLKSLEMLKKDPQEFLPLVLDEDSKTLALELRQLNFLQEAARKNKKAAYWNFIDPTADQFSSFGLGYRPFLELRDSQIFEFNRRKELVRAQTRKLLLEIAAREKQLRRRMELIGSAAKIQSDNVNRLKGYLDGETGVKISPLELTDALENLSEFQVENIVAEMEERIQLARLKRVLLAQWPIAENK